MDLSIVVNGITFLNPFLLGSGPPGTNARVIAKSYDAGWGGAVAKTISLESAKVINVVPRYGKLRSKTSGEVIGVDELKLPLHGGPGATDRRDRGLGHQSREQPGKNQREDRAPQRRGLEVHPLSCRSCP